MQPLAIGHPKFAVAPGASETMKLFEASEIRQFAGPIFSNPARTSGLGGARCAVTMAFWRIRPLSPTSSGSPPVSARFVRTFSNVAWILASRFNSLATKAIAAGVRLR